MKLTEALTLRLAYNDLDGKIKVDENGYICLNDLGTYFPSKRIDNWKRLDTTIEFIESVDSFLNTSDVRDLKSLVTKRGKYNGGTYAHELVAMEFCTWLSPEFKLKVYLEYMRGSQKKKDWNIKRILSAYNFKIMTKSIQDSREEVKPYHYSNESKMINKVIFERHDKGLRESATEQKLDDIAWLEGKNSAYIDIGMDYQERKKILNGLYEKRESELFEKQSKICDEKASIGATCGCFVCDQHSIAFGIASSNPEDEWIIKMVEYGLTERESKRWCVIFDDLGV